MALDIRRFSSSPVFCGIFFRYACFCALFSKKRFDGTFSKSANGPLQPPLHLRDRHRIQQNQRHRFQDDGHQAKKLVETRSHVHEFGHRCSSSARTQQGLDDRSLDRFRFAQAKLLRIFVLIHTTRSRFRNRTCSSEWRGDFNRDRIVLHRDRFDPCGSSE